MDYQLDSKPTESVPLKYLKPDGEIATAGVEKGERRESESWGTVWYNYSQNTTLHGVNKITDDTPFMFRRVLWLCIVCLGFALFLNQLIASIMYFYQRPVTVNVKINYNTTLTFPAVTICNQNDFRTTAAAERNMYALIQKYYSNLGANHTDVGVHGNLTLDVLYSRMAHKKDDMIVSCSWDERDCAVGEFREILTDYGQCFSFNMVQNGTQPRIVDRTGADRGLKLLVNVEQYEYMLGPNPGAGVKVLIHENTEVPSVRDLGHAIPPGTHAYVGIQITEVKNLPNPHGQCNNSVELQYFDDYSVPACVLECKARFLQKICKCRDFYMKSEDKYGNPAKPVCTMDQYQDCAIPTLIDDFYNYPDEGINKCDCPISCGRLMYDPTISYAGISSFDTTRYKRSPKMKGTYEKFLTARETFQRVDVATVEDDKRLMAELNTSIQQIDGLLDSIAYNVDMVQEIILHYRDALSVRTSFHKRWGLEKIKYIVHNNFVRGWEVVDERTLSLVTVNYQEMTAFVKRLIDLASVDLQTASDDTLESYYLSSEQYLYSKQVLCDRAKDNITTVHSGFINSVPLVTYVASPKRHFDESFVAPSIILAADEAPTLMTKFETRLNEFCGEVERIRGMMSDLKTKRTVNKTDYERTSLSLEKAARSYNYYRYRFFDRVVLKTDKIADDILERFSDANTTLYSGYRTTGTGLNAFMDLLDDLKSAWTSFKQLNNMTGDYLKGNLNKTALAEYIFSDEIVEARRLLKSYFTQIKVSSVNLDVQLTVNKRDVDSVWKVMLGEVSTKKFYQQLLDELTEMKTNATLLEDYKGIYAYLLDTNSTWIENNVDDLVERMNADFARITLEEKQSELDIMFSNLTRLLDLYAVMGSNEDDFFMSLDNLERELKTFIDYNILDGEFFSRNYLSIDVFMKELSYEEIEQQIGYDSNALWSDIGGSIGLFVGASIISCFEILDAILHPIFKKLLRRCKDPPTRS